MNTSLLHMLSKNWWVLLLRGLFAVIFGILAFAWPGLTMVMLVLMWGIYAGLDGIFALVAAIKGGSPAPRWWLILVGLLGIGAAAVCIINPGMATLVILMIIGWASIIRGVFEIIGAIQIRKEIEGEFWLILSGIFSILFGLVFLIKPGAGLIALIWLVASLAIVFGIALILLSLRLKKHSKASA
jgi:uncharacterized membrane protein HdeD (DUF308 family)